MSRNYGPAGDLFAALEQLEAIRELLQTNAPLKSRMALILLDGLADALLFRRLEQIYDASEEPLLRHRMPVYSKRQRQKARQRFGLRVDTARSVTGVDYWRGDGEELIDGADAAILKVGHNYRNDAYREDCHNPFVVSSLARVLFAAVARLVARSLRSGYGVGGISDRRLDQLAAWGFTGSGMLEVRAAAETITERFIATVPVDPAVLRDTLAADLESRADELDGDLGFLAESGHDPARIIAGVELWDTYGADAQLLALARRFDPFVLIEESGGGKVTDEARDEADAAVRAYRARMDELERGHKARVTPALVERARHDAERLRTMSDASKIVVSYHDVDRALARLEKYVAEAVSELDRAIQMQIDIERGK